jgi:hypothetical protein
MEARFNSNVLMGHPVMRICLHNSKEDWGGRDQNGGAE